MLVFAKFSFYPCPAATKAKRDAFQKPVLDIRRTGCGFYWRALVSTIGFCSFSEMNLSLTLLFHCLHLQAICFDAGEEGKQNLWILMMYPKRRVRTLCGNISN